MDRFSKEGGQVVQGGPRRDKRFMLKRYKDKAEVSRQRHASVVGGVLGNEKGGATVVRKPWLTKGGRRQPTGVKVPG